jgi:MFS superfamily sulfate permease-like transporter
MKKLFAENLRDDALAGFIVFLIALPLCLGISMASGFPPFAGIITAVIGGLLVTPLMGTELAIKGPAAGLIVIALGAVEELGEGDASRGYRLALAAIAVSGLVQIGFALARAGRLGDIFPSSAVRGMLAAIGILITSKQVHVALGVKPTAKTPVGLLLEIPKSLAHAHPKVALIGAVSLAILLAWPRLPDSRLRKIPAQLIVLLIAIPLGIAFDLNHAYEGNGLSLPTFHVGPEFLVSVPAQFLSVLTFPDFSHILSKTSLEYIAMFALVGSIETVLSSKAVDTFDPQNRRSNLDRDLLAVGLGNAVSGLLGGLPMITEIVRSSANVQAGAKTRRSNFIHGALILFCVALLPALVHRIPLAALAAMLVFTGLRLASPKELFHAYHLGLGELFVFIITTVLTLATDLLIGVASGVALTGILHLFRGVSWRDLFRASVELNQEGSTHVLSIRRAATFANYLGIRSTLARVPADASLVIDVQEAYFVDLSVRTHLDQAELDRTLSGGAVSIRGIERFRRATLPPPAPTPEKAKAKVLRGTRR